MLIWVKMKKLTLLFLFIIFSSQLFAQSFYNRRVDRQWVGSFGTGVAKYFGDLANPGEVFKNAKWNIEFGLERRIDKRFSARTALTIFQLEGGDLFADSEGRKVRNLSFTTTAFELSAIGTVQLFEDGARYYQRKPINVFLLAGLGATWYIPKGLSTNVYHDGSPNPSAGKMVALRTLQTEGTNYSPVTIVVPIGGGAKLMATPFLNITVSGAYRFAFTDYLDDVSTVYPDVTSFQDPLAAAMSNKRFELDGVVYDEGSKRGNPDNNDGYFIFSIRADYFLPPTLFGTKRRSPKGSRYKRPKRR
jgi:hypothetical protein